MSVMPTAETPKEAFPHGFPSELRFKKHVFAGVSVQKSRIKIRSRVAQYSTANQNIVEWLLPNDAFYKFNRGMIQFDVTIAVTGPPGSAAWMSQGAWSLFRHIRVVAPTEIENKRYQAKWISLTRDIFCEDGVTLTIGPMWGVDTLANRQANALVTTRFSIPIDSALFGEQVLPASLSPATNLILQYELAPTNESLEWAAGTTSATVTITNALLIGNQLQRAALPGSNPSISSAAPDYYGHVMARLASEGKLQFGFREVEFQQFAPITGASMQIPVQQRAVSVDFVFVTLQLQGYDTVGTNLDKFLTCIKGTGGVTVTQAQLKRNGIFYPPEPWDFSGQAHDGYQEFQVWANKWHSQGVFLDPTPISIADYNNDRFFIIFPINAFANSGLVSRESTAASNIDMTIQINFSGVLPAPLQANIFTVYFENVNLTRDGTWDRSK
jgi:hypothetical protein